MFIYVHCRSQEEASEMWTAPLGVATTALELCKVISLRVASLEAEILLTIGWSLLISTLTLDLDLWPWWTLLAHNVILLLYLCCLGKIQRQLYHLGKISHHKVAATLLEAIKTSYAFDHDLGSVCRHHRPPLAVDTILADLQTFVPGDKKLIVKVVDNPVVACFLWWSLKVSWLSG